MPKIYVIDPNGMSTEVNAPVGKSILEIAQANNFDVEGACEGSLACSTCHVIVDRDWFEKLLPADEEELSYIIDHITTSRADVRAVLWRQRWLAYPHCARWCIPDQGCHGLCARQR